MKYATTLNGRTYLIEINDDRHVIVDGVEHAIDFTGVAEQAFFSLILNSQSYEAFVEEEDDRWLVLLRGALYEARVADEREERLRNASAGAAISSGEIQVKSPMPGLIVAVPVAEGQAVAKGEVLVILESMKMQNELKSPREGVVGRVRVKAGDNVDQNQVMVTLT
jgi:biotin carboxyl carrier protein